MVNRITYTIIFLLLINVSLGQRLPKDSLYVPKYTFEDSDRDYLIIYNRVKGIRLKLTMKTLYEGNDYRVRVKLSPRVKIIGDLICSDYNPENFLYSLGILIRL